MHRIFHYHHEGYDPHLLMSFALLQWIMLMLFVFSIGSLIFVDTQQMKFSMNVVVWGGLFIVLITAGVREAQRI